MHFTGKLHSYDHIRWRGIQSSECKIVLFKISSTGQLSYPFLLCSVSRQCATMTRTNHSQQLNTYLSLLSIKLSSSACTIAISHRNPLHRSYEMQKRSGFHSKLLQIFELFYNLFQRFFLKCLNNFGVIPMTFMLDLLTSYSVCLSNCLYFLIAMEIESCICFTNYQIFQWHL